ncbi:heme peroxidase [Tuber borchii]|uniref:Heme peroxidase n=1 Tax=Tuber borchii TaxID=42251 RepID=A0A2T6ZBE7_TUBBO|nr:heme peroxidase [Tuber borchii]
MLRPLQNIVLNTSSSSKYLRFFIMPGPVTTLCQYVSVLIIFGLFHTYVVEKQLMRVDDSTSTSLDMRTETMRLPGRQILGGSRMRTCSRLVDLSSVVYIIHQTLLGPLIPDLRRARFITRMAPWVHDDQWTKDFYKGLFPGRDTRNIEISELLRGVGRWEASLSDDPLNRNIAGLDRKVDGSYHDDALVKILTESFEDVTGALSERNIPHFLYFVEVLGIEQSPKWQVASLNEFCEFFGLKPQATFKDINPDPAVAKALRQLYDYPDFVEIYAGLVVEADKKPMVPVVCIGPTYTISRAILSDAVTLVRGDRFYTADYTAAHLTNWGLQEESFPKKKFKFNSIYAHYPLTIPEENHKIHTALNMVDQFDFERPVYTPLRVPMNLISSYSAMKQIPCDANNFKVTCGAGFDVIMRANFMLSSAKPSNTEQKQQFYEERTEKLILKKAYRVSDAYPTHAIRDIRNIVQTMFAALIFNLPMKREDRPKETYTEQELYTILCGRLIISFFDIDSSKSFPLRQAGFKVVRQYGNLFEAQIKVIKNWSWLQGV